jgi:hypothetical protein
MDNEGCPKNGWRFFKKTFWQMQLVVRIAQQVGKKERRQDS